MTTTQRDSIQPLAGGLSRRRLLVTAGATALGTAIGGSIVQAQEASPVASPAAARDWRGERWVGTWALAPRLPVDWTGAGLIELTDQTLRQIAHISIGGDQVRVRLTNAHTGEPVVVGAAHIGFQTAEAGVEPDSNRTLTFGGRPSITLPPDAVVVSDSVELAVPDLADLAVTLYLPGTVSASEFGLQTTYVSPPGDFASEAEMPVETTVQSVALLSGIDVLSAEAGGAIVAFGDSITDGFGSTLDANLRWPDVLAVRLVADGAATPLGVVNVGIGGNRVLNDGPDPVGFGVGASALARFDRDVLAQPGVTHVIVLEGINDIGMPLTGELFGEDLSSEEVSAEEIISGLAMLAERAHQYGLVIYGGTLTPIGGSVYETPETEAKREAINEWIQTGGAFDAVIDFDAAVRDPDEPTRMLPEYDSGDGLHPGDAGYQAMGEAIDLALFR